MQQRWFIGMNCWQWDISLDKNNIIYRCKGDGDIILKLKWNYIESIDRIWHKGNQIISINAGIKVKKYQCWCRKDVNLKGAFISALEVLEGINISGEIFNTDQTDKGESKTDNSS